MTQRRRDTEDNEPIDTDKEDVELVIFDRTEHGQVDDDERRERGR